jgi:hypothetical protein
MCLDAVSNLFSALDVRGLNIDRAHTELLPTKTPFIVRSHVVFNKIPVTSDLAHKIGFVASLVEITVPDLAVIVRTHGVISLTDVHHHMHIIRQP